MTPGDVTLILLASGLSERFGGDKLMAPCDGTPIMARAASVLAHSDVTAGFATVGTSQNERRALLSAAGWTIVDNSDPAAGQGRSLAIAMAAAGATDCSAAVILLADMPAIPQAHVPALITAMEPETDAIMSQTGDTLLPPAIFHRRTFPALAGLTGDEGARQIFNVLTKTKTLPLSAHAARDIDTPGQLAAFESQTHA